MEAGWDRTSAFVELTETEVRAMLAPVGATVTAVTPLSSGLANTNYRIDLKGGPTVVLRLYTRSPAVAATEVALLRLVRKSVPVAEVLFADTTGERTGRPYAVTTWLEGSLMLQALADADEAAQRAIGRGAAETLVQIQTHRFDRPGFFAPDGSLVPSGTLPPFRGHIAASLLRDGGAANLGPALTQQVLRFVDDHAELLPVGEPTVLVHGDYKASNLLLTGAADGWRISGVLDWEFAFAGPPLFDLTMLLRYSDAMPAFEAGVIEGYRRTGSALPDNWKQRVRLLDLVNLCSFVTGPNRSEARLRDVRTLIEQTLERWDSYANA